MQQLFVPFGKILAASALAGIGFTFAAPAQAQSQAQQLGERVPIDLSAEQDAADGEAETPLNSGPPEKIDLLAEQQKTISAQEALEAADDAYGPRKPKPCPKSSDPNEIIVCAAPQDDSEFYYSGSAENARKRYAEETAFKDDPQAPNFLPTCHSMGNPAGCVRVGSVPPQPILIDLESIPEAPEGSDADLVAKGEKRLD